MALMLLMISIISAQFADVELLRRLPWPGLGLFTGLFEINIWIWRHGKQPAQKKRLGCGPGSVTVARFNREQMHVLCCRFYTQYVPVCMTKALEGQVRTHKIRIRMLWLGQAAQLGADHGLFSSSFV
jgi:hypothetical protein